MTDPAEIRAEGRRLLAAAGRGGHFELTDLEVFMVDNAPVLLADPAPVGLTEDDLAALRIVAAHLREVGYPAMAQETDAIIDRLSAAPVDDQGRVPEGEVSTVTALGYGAGPTVIVATDGTRLHVEDTGEYFANGGHAYHWVPVSPSVDPEEEP